jgi:predicted dehydrogenase
MKISIVGAGLIGNERIEAVKYITNNVNKDIYINAVFDTNQDLLNKVKQKHNIPTASSLEELLQAKPDWVFISTPNDVVIDIARQCFAAGANVLVEKPFGRTLEECDQIIALKPNNCQLFVGFNYRFFAGIEAALADARAGKFGKLISVNLILGHGNAPGMEKSWKLDPERCGSVVTDLGVHLFDISLQLSKSDVSLEYAKTWKGYWNTGIDEETHMILSNEEGTVFNAQVSLDRWRSTFKLEINGTEGYGVVDCRGRSYGPQSYKTGVRWGWAGSNKTQAETEICVIDKDECKDSFLKETIAVLNADNNPNRQSQACDYVGARKIMYILDQYFNVVKNG